MTPVGQIGTLSGVVLRCMRGVLASASFYFMYSASNSDLYSFYRYLKNVVMPMHIAHAACVILYDIYCMTRRGTHRRGVIYTTIFLSEWLHAYLALGVAAGSLAVTMGLSLKLLHEETSYYKYLISVSLVFVVWLLTAFSTVTESFAFGAAWRAHDVPH